MRRALSRGLRLEGVRRDRLEPAGTDQLGYELSNVEIIGDGIDDACDDRDCKAVPGQVDTVIYRLATKKTEYAIDAQISG